jgi:two-component system sensor histidine kinase KdpD
VVGYVETYARPMTIAAVADLEVIPRREIEYRGVKLEELDLDAVIARHPDVVLIDEIAHTNAPGSRHEKRWQDATELLEHGITVISTMNIQHLDSLADIVERITGAPVHERVPDHVLDEADEVQLVDLTPHALRQRIRHGNVYPPDRAQLALEGFFREGNLTALREIVLRRLSSVVEDELQEYMRGHDLDAAWPASQGVLVVADPTPAFGRLLRRAVRSAGALQAPLTVVWAEPPSWGTASPEARAALEENLRLADDLGAEVVRRAERDPIEAILQVGRDKNVESIYVAREQVPWWRRLAGARPMADRLMERASGFDLHVTGKEPAEGRSQDR